MPSPVVKESDVEARGKIETALVDQMESGKLDLPLLPQVASQVMALTSDPDADAMKLSTLIHQDQALAARVLRIANSPAYMPRVPIVSLQQAVARLGMNLLAEIAVIASIRGGSLQAPGYEEDLKQLWQHAYASGAYAKEIARVRRLNVEGAFLCGLLHAIGKPVVLRSAVQLAGELGIVVDAGLIKELMNDHHNKVGKMIAGKWSLPKLVETAIAHYLDYSGAPAFAAEVMITSLADHLATQLMSPDAMDEEAVRKLPVVAALNLYPDDMDILLGARETVFRTVEAMAL
jgi:HD-like signal output (HDOD) protein